MTSVTTTTQWLDSYPYVKNRQTTGLVKWESYQILDKEIDQSLQNTLSSSLCDVSDKDIPLHTYSNIPEFLKGNPYVTDGFRVSLPFTLCLKGEFSFVTLIFVSPARHF